jgi:hypothetical protein
VGVGVAVGVGVGVGVAVGLGVIVGVRVTVGVSGIAVGDRNAVGCGPLHATSQVTPRINRQVPASLVPFLTIL